LAARALIFALVEGESRGAFWWAVRRSAGKPAMRMASGVAGLSAT